MATKARAEVEVTASSSKLAAGLRAARAQFSAFAGFVGKGMKGLVSSRAMASGIGNVGGDLARRGLDFITEQAVGVRNFESSLARLQIAANRTPEEMNALRDSIREVSRETGIADGLILEGTQTYVDLTGDVKGAEAAMESFARIAQASGASVSDVSQAAAALKDAMDIDPTRFEAVFSGMIMQGKAGAVGLRDFAGLLASLAPRMGLFKGGKSEMGARELGAALQVARKGFGNASEAATGMESLMGSIVQNAKKLKKAGVDIYDRDPKTGIQRLKGFSAIIESMSKSKFLNKSDTNLFDTLGRKEAIQTFHMLKGNAALYQDLIRSGEDAGAVQRDLDTYLQSSAGRLDSAWNNIKIAVAEALTPERITRFVAGVEDLAKKLIPVAERMAQIAGAVIDAGGALFRSGQAAREALMGGGAGDQYLDWKYGSKRASMIQDPQAYAAQQIEKKKFEDALSAISFTGAKGAVGSQLGDKGFANPLQAALAYSYSGDDAKRTAGEAWMKETGFQSPAQITRQLAGLLAKIEYNTKHPPPVQVGSNAIVAAAKNAAGHRRRTQ